MRITVLSDRGGTRINNTNQRKPHTPAISIIARGQNESSDAVDGDMSNLSTILPICVYIYICIRVGCSSFYVLFQYPYNIWDI